MKKMSKLSVVLLILLVITVSIIAYILLNQMQLTAKQEDWINSKQSESATFVVPKETNIRKYPTIASSDEDNVELIISSNREYTWYVKVSSYYKTVDYFGRTWYGVAADEIDLEDCPYKLAKWCQKHPDLIFWFSTAGGVAIQK